MFRNHFIAYEYCVSQLLPRPRENAIKVFGNDNKLSLMSQNGSVANIFPIKNNAVCEINDEVVISCFIIWVISSTNLNFSISYLLAVLVRNPHTTFVILL
jgi:hypothetical protein